MSAPDAFNYLGREKEHDLFVFFNKDYNFGDRNTLTELVDSFWNDSYTNVGAIYSDSKLKIGDEIVPAKIHPSFSKNIYLTKTVMNVPFIVKSSMVPQFHPEIQLLYLWDGMLQLMERTLIFHRAKFDYVIENMSGSMSEMQREIKQINELYK